MTHPTDVELDEMARDLCHTGELSMPYRSEISDAIVSIRAQLAEALQVPEVQAIVEALKFYADRDNYETVYERMPCDCCTDIYEPVMRDEGDTARAAIAAWKEATK